MVKILFYPFTEEEINQPDGIANALFVAVARPDWTDAQWDDLPPDHQEGWRRAAQRVRDTLSAELNAERECAR